ncbi:glutathione S-transferase N-terminal domain-containing protein [Candidatus Kaiserbacteria bacterium]|nr:MAG: glutathione S-transferase N-terminal domain-containing protein [Candidatus Kaiserbacteria bacterium]
MKLYYRPTCPYCIKVVLFARENDIAIDLRDISTNEADYNELLSLGGKQQVPFLVDEKAGVSMYESDDIIAYLKETHGK